MRITAIVLSACVVVTGVVAAPTVAAKDYMVGDNPMCIRVGDTDGVKKRICLEASDTRVSRGEPVTFSSRLSAYEPGTEVCLARSDEPYGAYLPLAACTTVNKNGSVSITANLGRYGTAWYDIGDAACLAKAPAKRPPRSCGDNGGVQSTPLRVTVR